MTNVAAGFHPFEDNAIGTVFNHAVGDGGRGSKTHHLGPTFLRKRDLIAARETTGKNDKLRFLLLDQLQMVTISGSNGDEVDCERFVRQPTGFIDLLFENVHRGVASGKAAESTMVTDSRDQFGLTDPRHGSTENWILRPQKFPPPLKKAVKKFSFTHMLLMTPEL